MLLWVISSIEAGRLEVASMPTDGFILGETCAANGRVIASATAGLAAGFPCEARTLGSRTMAKARAAKELTLADFRAESVRGSAGFFRVGRTHGGRWWLLDPEGRPFFSRGVAAVNRQGRAATAPGQVLGGYAQTVWRRWGVDVQGFPEHASERLAAWGANTLGPWADDAFEDAGWVRTEVVDFRGAGAPVIHAHGVHLPDVFDSRWLEACDARAAAVAARWGGNAGLAGWFTDAGLDWGGDDGRENRLSLLQVCLSLEPSFAAFHAAWEFVLAPHGGELEALGCEWGLELAHRETVRQLTLAERAVATAGFSAADARFGREFARRYFSDTAGALRRHDPDHLVLGCRFAQAPGESVLAECVFPRVDVISARAGVIATGEVEMPVLWVDAGTDNDRFRRAPLSMKGLSRTERMLREERRILADGCARPEVVGYEWGRWADGDTDEPPFGTGLVHVDGREAPEHVEVFAQANRRARRRG